MSQARAAWKVGVFVVIALTVLATLMVLFSKGASIFQPTYALRLKTSNVGLLISGAPVLMAGVQIGSIDRIRLDAGGRSVTLWARIRNEYRISRDARFVIDQVGLLGDQYVSVIPQENRGTWLQDGDEVTCEEPFNVQSVARSSVGLIQRVDETVQRLKTVVVRLDEMLLAPETLTNLVDTFDNLRDVSFRAASGFEGLDQLVQTNKAGVTYAVSNLVVFSEQLNNVAQQLNEVVSSNRADFSAAIRNVRVAAESAGTVLTNLQTGQGVAGFVLQDPVARNQMANLLSNMTVLSSNLNRFGLMYKPKKQPAPGALRSPAGRQQAR